MTNFEEADPRSVVSFVLENLPRHKQLTLGTISKGGQPWVVCLNLAYDQEMNIIWKSRRDTEHSKHVINHPEVAICIFSEEPSVGDFGFYARAVAHEITNQTELANALETRYMARGKPAPSPQSFTGDSPHRLYIAKLSEAWVNDDRHQKTPIDLDLLRSHCQEA